jgi:small subunit ribosomal protein S3e
MSTEIRVISTRTKEIFDKNAKKIRELKSLVEKRYNFNEESNKVELSVKPALDKNLCAAAQCETLKYKLLGGAPVRMAANSVLGLVMRRGLAIGCEVMVSGKVRGQRAKAMKYKQGYLVSTGQPYKDFVQYAVRHVELRQGILGVKVKIMMDTDKVPGKSNKVMPDKIKIHEPKDDDKKYDEPTAISNMHGQ